MANSEQKKAAALNALAESSTLTEAAEKAGISRKTLYSYIRYDFDFSRAYKSLLEEAAIQALENMADQRERASKTLLSIMEDEKQPGMVRLKAAQAILSTISDQAAIVDSVAASNVSKNTPDLFDFSLH